MKNQKKLILSVALAAIPVIVASVMLVSQYRVARTAYLEQKVAVKPGDTLSGILSPHELSGSDILEIAKLLRKDAGVRRIRAESDIIKIERPRESEPVSKITLQSGPWRQIEFTKEQNGEWACTPIDIEKDVQVVRKAGEIRDGDSFYVAGIRAEIPESVLADAYDLLAFEMDFERDMRAGQEFEILYEENYADGEFIDTGRVIAVLFDTGAKNRGIVKMYRFKTGYYDENGLGAIKSLKRTPINNARVTSSFSGNRRHPVLGYTRAHKGVDFRAGTGTPIPAAGAGRIVDRGTNNGYGNYIRIRHNATYETMYAHMSRFQSGVRSGTQVKQGQVVGYVGSTGISTGPHLHYEIIRNGQRVNPMTVKLPAINNLANKDRENFLALRAGIDRALQIMKENPAATIVE